MRRSKWWVGPLVAMVVMCSPVLIERTAVGQDARAAKKAKKRPDRAKKERPARQKGPRGEWAIMAKVLEMNEAQTTDLMKAVESSGKAVADWNAGAAGQKLKELREEAKKAREAKDKEKTKSLSQEMNSLQKELSELQAAQKAQIMDLLTAEQKAKWAGFTLYRNVMRRYKRVKPDEGQDKQLRDLCAAKAKDQPASSDRKAYGAAMKALYGEIEENILTAAQREELKKKPEKAPKGGGEKKARGKKTAKAGGAAVIVD